MPKMNGEMRAAERRALAYRNEPIGGGVKVRRKAACYCFRLFMGKGVMEELETAQKVTGCASVAELVILLCRQAMRDPEKVREIEKERQAVRERLEKGRCRISCYSTQTPRRLMVRGAFFLRAVRAGAHVRVCILCGKYRLHAPCIYY